jgi:orotate phosphoribosyltransferase
MDTLSNSLVELLVHRAFQKIEGITLASGLRADYYIDCKKLSLHGPSLKKVSEFFWKLLSEQKILPTHVAGVSVGGDPLVAGIILEASAQQQALEALLIRKEAKKHGMSKGRAVEGNLPNDSMKIWLIEDVVSTGKSSLEAAAQLKNEGYPLHGVMALVDREMGGIEKLEKELNVPVIVPIKVSQILKFARG